MKTATARLWLPVLLVSLASTAVSAQTIGDEFIYFVNGTNILVPTSQATVVNDPLAPTSGNKVARFNAASYTHAGFAFSRTEGVDATGLVGATFGESDTLYVRMLSDPANASQTSISLAFTDKTDDSGAADGTADNEFRLIWPIPAELHDGQWHNLAIPLPPATRAALEAAKADGTIPADSPAALWDYSGAWSGGGFGIGPNFGGTVEDPLFREFEWNALYKFGPFWDNAVGGGPIYFDYAYIGGPGTDIEAASGAPAAMSGTTFAANGTVNQVSWTQNPDFGGYNVYVSQNPITDVAADDVLLLETVPFNEPATYAHRYEVPHPSLGAQPLYYAVTSLSQFGVENPAVSASSGEVTNPDLAQKAFIRQLTDEEADALFEDVSARRATDANFPADQPVFRLDDSHRSAGDGTTAASLPSVTDNSGLFKIGYTNSNEMIIYGEITDDQVTFAGDGLITGLNTWMYDSAEIVFGHYDVRTATKLTTDVDGGRGGILVGSPHTDMVRGDEPDYGFRISAFQDASGNLTATSTWIGWSIDADFANATALEKTATGWKFLSLVPLDAIQNASTGDVFLRVPAADQLQLIPFVISLNDADGATRDAQQIWSIKPNVSGLWYRTPNQWETVAIAGRDLKSTAVEDGALRDGFALAQSSPNPAGGPATVAFTLGEQRHVRLEVFNALGQRVAVVADGEFAAGTHRVGVDAGRLAAGVYVYRLSAGDYVATRRMTVVR